MLRQGFLCCACSLMLSGTLVAQPGEKESPPSGQNENPAQNADEQNGDQEGENNSLPPAIPETVVEAEQTPNPPGTTSDPPVTNVPFTESFPRAPLNENVAVTPNFVATPRQQVGSTLSVVTQEQIRRNGHKTVSEVLRSLQVPGLDVAQSGGPGRQTSIFLRGANSNHTKVLLDGMPLNDPSANRAFDFSTLTVDNIERIEVLKGPQSTLYGSDAIGGVINIITRRGEGPAEFRFSTSGGSFDSFRQSAGVSGGDETFYYSFDGSFFETNGISAASEANGNTERDGFRNGTASGRAGVIFNEQFDIDVLFRYTDADAEVDGFSFATGLPTDDLTAKNLSETFFTRTQARLLLFDGILEQKVGFNYGNYNREAIGAFPAFFNADTYKFDYQANLITVDNDWMQSIFTMGTEYLDENVETAALGSQMGLHNTALYVQQQTVFRDRWSTTVGGRWDDYSQAGTAETWRVTSRYEVKETGTAFHGAIGTGFRAPSVNELFGLSGNVALRPEESKSYEVGIEQRFFEDDIVVDATYFRNNFDDLIVFVFNGAPPFGGQLVNVDRALATGVELTGRIQLTDTTTLTTSYTHTETRDRGTGDPLLRRPRHKFGFGVNQRFLEDRANLNFGIQYIGDRNDFGGVTLEDYTLANISMTYDVNPGLQFFTRIENAFDEEYEEVAGFGTAPLSAYAGVVWTFGGKKNRRCGESCGSETCCE